MTINIADNSPRISYTVAQGQTQTSFAVPFEFFDNADLNVYIDGTLKTITTHYTVSGGDGSTGTVSMSVTGGTGGSTVVITRDIELERTTDFPVSGAFNIVALNTELDRLVAIAADLEDQSNRALQLTDFDAAVSLVLPDVDTRKGKTLAFNASTGAVEAGPSISDTQTVSAASADIALLADIQDGTTATNAITTVASNNSNVSTVAGISANVTTVAGNNANVTTVATDLSGSNTIGTVAGSISNVNTVGGSISNVNTVATDLSGSNNIGTVVTNIANINTVGGISGNVTTVAGISSNITTLAGISSDITAVANVDTELTAVSAKITEVQTVANDLNESISEIETVANDLNSGNFVAGTEYDFGSITNATTGTSGSPNGFIVTVYNNLSDITSVAGQVSNISTVGSISSDVSTVAGISSNVTTVAGISANVTSVAGVSSSIPTVAGISSDVSTVAGISSNVSTVASNVSSINDFAARYRIGTTDPTTSLDAGDMFYNTSTTTLKIYNGSSWEAGVTAGSGFLAQSSNLADLQSASTARTNLGLGTAATSATGDFAAASHTHTLSNITDSGTMASQNANNVNITGGIIDGGSIV
mgnify:CR=1 FL=1|jgi:hypothetical protein